MKPLRPVFMKVCLALVVPYLLGSPCTAESDGAGTVTVRFELRDTALSPLRALAAEGCQLLDGLECQLGPSAVGSGMNCPRVDQPISLNDSCNQSVSTEIAAKVAALAGLSGSFRVSL